MYRPQRVLKDQDLAPLFAHVFFPKTAWPTGFPGGSDGKASACNAVDPGSFRGWEDPLEKEMAIHSSTLAWKIPWTEEPDRLQSMGSQRVGHDWATELNWTEQLNRTELSTKTENKCRYILLVFYSHIHIKIIIFLLFFCMLPQSLCRMEKEKWSHSVVSDCDPMDCSLSGSSIHGIFQARVLEWIAISFSRGSSQPQNQTWVSCIAGRCFTIWATREASK